MTYTDQLALLDAIENFSVPIIPPTTHFWMIRTKKGYFYNEFLSKRFVAVAWNNISPVSYTHLDVYKRQD